MDNNPISRHEYVTRVLDAYRKTPGTTGHIRRQDRILAEQLYEKSVPLTAVQNALILAAARRLLRPDDAPSLDTIRSLHYFRPVIDEVMSLSMNDEYFAHLRRKIAAMTTIKAE